MRIAIDYISSIGAGGVSVYTRELTQALAENDKKNTYYLYYFVHDFLPGRKRPKFSNKNFKLKPAYFSQLKFPIPVQFVNFINKISLKAFAKFNKIDVFHFTNPLNFIKGPYKSIVTIHDLSILHNENWVQKVSADSFGEIIKNILIQADKIITDAQFTKNDVVEFFNVDAEKINPIHLAAGDIFHPDLDEKYLKEKFNLENYILYMGELHPRKNIIGLLKAYGKLDIKLREDYNLVLAGVSKNKNFSNKLAKTIKNLDIKKQIKQLGFITDNDLPKLYSGAKFLAYPSLFEGFGLPVLESLSCGVPVITSNSSTLPEVAGNAGILIDPKNIGQIKSAMEKLLLDEQFYQDLKNRCPEQASKFSWQKTAKETLAVYEEIYPVNPKVPLFRAGINSGD